MINNPYYLRSPDFSPIAGPSGLAGLVASKEQENQRQQLVQKAQEVAGSGDTAAMRDFAIANPELGKLMFEVGGIVDNQAQGRMVSLTKNLVSSPNPVETLKAHIANGQQSGRDMTHSVKLLQQSEGDPEKLNRMVEMSLAVQDPQASNALQKTRPQAESSNAPGSVRETEWFLKQTPEVQKKHLELKRKTDPTMAEKLEFEQSKSDIAIGEAGSKKTAEGISGRQQGYIDSGVEAADALGNARKVRDLLNSVETGGFDAAALSAKRLFGIESGDEAELSAGLGKAILSQLKPIFGAAFTAAEGERLEKIEANFGKSTEGNKRLINSVIKTTERAAKRGIRAAEAQGDQFAADEIREALEMIKGAAESQTPTQQQDYAEGTVIRNPTTGETMTMVNGVWTNG